MALVLIKKPEIKFPKFLETVKIKVRELGYDELGAGFSIVVVPETSDKSISYSYGIASMNQLIRTLASMHKRRSSILVVGSKLIDQKFDDNPFPPYVIKTAPGVYSDHCAVPIFLPVSRCLTEIKDGTSLSRKKHEMMLRNCSIINMIKSFRVLNKEFVRELSHFYNKSAMVFIDKTYGMKIHNEDLFEICDNHVLFTELKEQSVGDTKMLSPSLPIILKSNIDRIGSNYTISQLMRNPNIATNTRNNKCVACGGTGFNSMGNKCLICDGGEEEKKEVLKETKKEKMEEVTYVKSEDTARELNMIERNPFLIAGLLASEKKHIDISGREYTFVKLQKIKSVNNNSLTTDASFINGTSVGTILEKDINSYNFFTIEEL